jgi:hypothetical protein
MFDRQRATVNTTGSTPYRTFASAGASWINDIPNPMYSTLQIKALSPEWIPKTYLGLSATSNHSPPATVNDFKSYQRLKDFRAMTYCHFRAGHGQ